MSSPNLTGRKSEILFALPIVRELAKDVLTPSELDKAENTSTMLAGNRRNKKEAVLFLVDLVAPPPKRPLYYAQHEMKFLPRWTRNGIRYLGDYIDLLVKAMAFEYTKDHGCKKSSLGINLRRLKPKKYKIAPDLLDKLRRYNSFLYQPGKHDFRLPKGRGHRFTSREVVLTAFITMKIAEEIKKISRFAKQLSDDQVFIQDL